MCGIVGFVEKRKNSHEIIKKMANRIIHRGPDSEGFYVDANIALGHRLLKLTKSEKQPIKIDDYVVMFDGKIYNMAELQKDLNLKTDRESAILVEGYKKWGKDLPSKLRGAFSFVIWNITDNSLFGARDHFGIKPLYYYDSNDVFIFASEIKAMLEHPSFACELNPDVLSLYMIFNFNPCNETFFKGVRNLAPGNLFYYQNGKISLEKYFSCQFAEEATDENKTIDLIGETIANSVNTHLENEKSFGSFLSSGIDSSYLVSLARPQKAYTVGYKEQKYSEISYAEDLTAKLGIESVSKIISKEEYMSVISKVMYHLDEPIADPGTVALYFGSVAASKDVKVIMSGEGADEFFGGYNIYQDIYKFKVYNKIPLFLRKIISKIASGLPEFKGSEFLIRRGQDIDDSYLGLNWVFKEKEVAKYLKFKPVGSVKSVTNEVYSEQKGQNDLTKMQAMDINFSLIKNFLVNGDKMAMANSLDVRVPFTDLKVFDVARKLPIAAKVTEKETKVYLRRAAQKVIPNDSYKKKKLGFPVPLREWVREDSVYDMIKAAFQLPIASELFNQKRIIKLLDDHRNRKKDNYKKVWTIYCFIVWYQEFFA